MLFAIDPNDTINQVIDGVTFDFKVLNFKEVTMIQNNIRNIKDDTPLEEVGNIMLKNLTILLKGWSGLTYKSGAVCSYSENKEKLIDILPFTFISKLINEGLKLNTVSEEDKGN